MKSFDKYEYYKRAVQSPETDVSFYRKTYRELKKKKPQTLREDFCGTFALSCEWVKLDKEHKAVGVDLAKEPLSYGRKHYLTKLNSDQQKRLKTQIGNVLTSPLPKVDIAVAVNFSFFIFKQRAFLKKYFSRVHQSLKKDGVFIIDCFGGTQTQDAIEESTNHRDFVYYWDQSNFNPLTNEAMFFIHFKRKGEKKRSKVFIYDWRIWSLQELKELLEEVGFKKTTIYWEGTTPKGTGNGKFSKATEGEICESWIAYIAAEK
jgi:SAM-dependent methyltransferase